MSYLYQSMGQGPSFSEIAAQVEAGTSPEDIKRRLAALDKAKREGALRIILGPFKKGLPVGFWNTIERAATKKWLASHLHKDALIQVAQRAGLLPLSVVTVPAGSGSPKQRFAFYGKWENPVYGTGTVKAGIFAWQDTDVFKKKKNEYKIPWSKGERDFFQKSMEIGKVGRDRHLWHVAIGKGNFKRRIWAYPGEKNLEISTAPPSDGLTFADVAVWSTFPAVKMNSVILEYTAPLIGIFGEILGALLDVVGAATGIMPFFGTAQAPEQQYKRPNYLLWGGVALGVVGLTYLYKRRSA